MEADLNTPLEEIQLALGILAGTPSAALVAADLVHEKYHGDMGTIGRIVLQAKTEEWKAIIHILQEPMDDDMEDHVLDLFHRLIARIRARIEESK